MKVQELQVKAVTPAMGFPGGEVAIECQGFRPGLPSSSRVLLGDKEAAIISASEDRLMVRLPHSPDAPGISLRVENTLSAVFPFTLGACLVTGLHPVTSPVVAPNGSVITTISGSRGQQIAQPLVRISREGEAERLNCEITNPTGLAFGPDGQLYVSSRNDGVVFRYTGFDHLDVVAEDLGIASGIAFDSRGRLYVGDRSGKIFRIGASGAREEFASLEPSVSAYHLCMDAADRLYVTGPTLAVRDSLYRVSDGGCVEVLLRGLARPQGLAALPDGNILLATGYAGKKGVFKIDPATGAIEHYIAGPTLVGVALADGEVVVADNTSVYRIRPPSPTG